MNTLHHIQKELDHMAGNLVALKDAIAEVAVREEAAVALIDSQRTELEAKDKRIAELEAGGGEAPEAEVNELTASAASSAEALKNAVEPPGAAVA
jgi:predicted  nucleic acid-binding Zn-ribbon protein